MFTLQIGSIAQIFFYHTTIILASLRYSLVIVLHGHLVHYFFTIHSLWFPQSVYSHKYLTLMDQNPGERGWMKVTGIEMVRWLMNWTNSRVLYHSMRVRVNTFKYDCIHNMFSLCMHCSNILPQLLSTIYPEQNGSCRNALGTCQDQIRLGSWHQEHLACCEVQT